ncbi:GtrA family protein [Lysobacter soyae]|uniref:GtrA family protein n=1 Tax=Lysobacter soyae TaxID=2764185 RepID=A0ABX8WP49_9GAMM|nr:GtrA family protein [Lysobacter sp. CJ11]QYR52731.1 GtrA family protein [Lysobacter sp. CJ11]
MFDLLKSNSAAIRQFVLYAICGGSGVLTDLAIFGALVSNGANYQLANFAGYAAGTLISFLLNRKFTFDAKDRPFERLALFLGTALLGYIVSSALLWVLISKLNFSPFVAKIATLGVVLVLQFSINKAVTFRTTEGSAS